MNILRNVSVTLSCFLFAVAAYAFDPITGAISKGVATALDVRSKEDVQADVEIDAAVTKKLVEQKGDEFKNISLLVFARHVVLVGFAKSDETRLKAEGLAKTAKKLRSLRNDIIVGQAGGNFGSNVVLDKKIDLTLTATKGVSSVNMRWKAYGGDVFLTGVAQSASEMNLAVRTVKGLDGVKTVHSSLRVGKK
jgi:osmotically-inducible protein OsmY